MLAGGVAPEKTLGERAIILMMGRIGAVVVGLATPMVLVRVFSQSEFGAYRQIQLALMTVLGILMLGFPQSLYYFFPKYPARRRTFVSQGFYSQVIFGCIFLGFTLFAGKILTNFFKHDIFLTASPLIGVIALFQLTRSYLESLMIVEKRVAWASLYIVGHDVLRGIALVVVVLIIPTLMAIIITLLIYEGMLFLFALTYTGIRYGLFRFPVAKDAVAEQSKYAFPLGFAGGIAAVIQRLDQFIIVTRYSPADFAIYSQGAFPMRFFNIPQQSIFDLVIPKVVTMIRDGQREELIRFWYDLVFKMAIITMPVVVLSQVVGTDAMVLLFTEQYKSSGYLFQVYVLMLLRFIPAYPVLPRAYGRTGIIMKSNMVALVVMVGLGWIGTIYLGMYGMVGALIISQYVMGYIQLQSGRRDLGLPRGQLLPWKRLTGVTLVAILSAVLPILVSLVLRNLMIRVTACILLYLICYVLLLYLMKVFDWVHDPAIRKVLHRYLPFVPA